MRVDPVIEYQEFAKTNPGVPFTQWFWEKELSYARGGGAHPSIGPRIDGDVPWLKSAKDRFSHHVRTGEIPASAKVLDYGCGTLRMGVHFIDYLEPGNYWGIDPTPGMIEMGSALLGEARITQKKPRLSNTNEPVLAEAAAWGADFVFSDNVAFHVPPGEMVTYGENLRRLSAKSGAHLKFNARFCAEVRMHHSPTTSGPMAVWGYPVGAYLQMLKPLELISLRSSPDKHDDKTRTGTMEFLSAG